MRTAAILPQRDIEGSAGIFTIRLSAMIGERPLEPSVLHAAYRSQLLATVPQGSALTHACSNRSR